MLDFTGVLAFLCFSAVSTNPTKPQQTTENFISVIVFSMSLICIILVILVTP